MRDVPNGSGRCLNRLIEDNCRNIEIVMDDFSHERFPLPNRLMGSHVGPRLTLQH